MEHKLKAGKCKGNQDREHAFECFILLQHILKDDITSSNSPDDQKLKGKHGDKAGLVVQFQTDCKLNPVKAFQINRILNLASETVQWGMKFSEKSDMTLG